MKGPQLLLHMLLAALAARALAPEALNPWRGWVTFKHYARLVDEVPDPGISVQIAQGPEEQVVRLLFLRQAIEPVGEWLAPVGGVVCEFTFQAEDAPQGDCEFWSFDHPSFERFVDVVEMHAEFADLMVKRPLSSAVYWEEA